jgi:integrase
MEDNEVPVAASLRRGPWNKGKLVGAKPPLRPKHVWSIRTKLQIADRKRDLAMFNLAIDSKLRGCDVVALKVEDIAPHGYAVERAMVRQKKTGVPVRFEVTEQTRQAVDHYIRAADRKPGDFLCAAPVGPGPVDPAICTPGRRLDSRHRSRSLHVWHPFAAPDQGHADLPAHRESSRGPTIIGPFQNRKYRAVPRHRGR